MSDARLSRTPRGDVCLRLKTPWYDGSTHGFFSHAAVPRLKDFMSAIKSDVIGKPHAAGSQQVDKLRLLAGNTAIECHQVE